MLSALDLDCVPLIHFDQALSSPRRNSRSSVTINTHRRSATTDNYLDLAHHSSQQTGSFSSIIAETIREWRGNA